MNFTQKILLIIRKNDGHVINQKGNIQLFSDPCSGEHLYFGRIIGDGDYYDYKSSVFDLSKLQDEESIIKNTLLEAFPNIKHIPQISVICFCEWR